MTKTPLLPPFALCALVAACSQEQPAPEPEPKAVAAEPAKPSLPAPDAEIFKAVFAKACPKAKPVNKSVCKRAGFGSHDVICEYGLGTDEYLRHKATLTPGEGEWVLANPEKTCAQGAR